jgi:succinyl-CoA synthetase alpha subunit
MAILLEAGAPVLVQHAASTYARGMVAAMRAGGTNVVAGVATGRGGERHEDTPWFDSVEQAVAATGAVASVCFAPPPWVHDAILEAADAGIRLLMVAAEYVPVHDAIPALAYARSRTCWVIGPNCIGLLSPGIGVLGGLSPALGTPGPVGMISRSGTLSLVLTHALTRAGLGQSTVVSIGGDAVIGRNPDEYVRMFDADPATRVIVLVGEIGGRKEYVVADLLAELHKPLIALIIGRHLPVGQRFGHAGALVSSLAEAAEEKRAALRRAGAVIADSPAHLVQLVGQSLRS